MIERILAQKGITGENAKKVTIFYRAISATIHSQTVRVGATHEDISKYFKKNRIHYSSDEISRFLQFMKMHGLVVIRDKNYWFTIY